MSAILDHLSEVSIFGRSLVWFVVLLGLDWIFSAVHAYEEWRVPLWRVFGAVVGLWLPNWLGFLLFTLGLTLILWSAGLLAIAGWFPLVGDVSLPVAIGALRPRPRISEFAFARDFEWWDSRPGMMLVASACD